MTSSIFGSIHLREYEPGEEINADSMFQTRQNLAVYGGRVNNSRHDNVRLGGRLADSERAAPASKG